MKKSIYDPGVYNDCCLRLNQLTANSEARWGRMNAAQMLSHCAEVVEVTNGKELQGTPWFVRLMKGVIRRMVLSEKPYPRDSRTHHQYEMNTAHDFNAEKDRLQKALDDLMEMHRSDQPVPPHPLFGSLTEDERGWVMFKHLDHHFDQFGV